MSADPICLEILHNQKSKRSQTAVLIFPGLVPMYSNLNDEVKLLSKFGDVLAFHYPETKMDIRRFYQEVARAIRQLGYKKFFFVGISFGGTLAYLLLRYWRRHRMAVGVRGFLALSTPFEPENLTPISQFQVNVGTTLDQYARQVFIIAVRIIRVIWRFSFGINSLYVRDNSLKQTLNAMWVGGYTLEQDWVVKKRVLNIPALLLNVRHDRVDRFVRSNNEQDFLEIFPNGKILRVLQRHADIEGLTPTAKRYIEEMIEEGLKAGAERFI